MKNLHLILFLFLFNSIYILAQDTDAVFERIDPISNLPYNIEFAPEQLRLSEFESFMEKRYEVELELVSENAFKQMYRQTFKGYPIEGSYYNVIFEEEFVTNAVGQLYATEAIDIKEEEKLDIQQILKNDKELGTYQTYTINNGKYRAPFSGENELVIESKGNFIYPEGAHIFYPDEFVLTASYQVFSADPLIDEHILVDYQTQKIIQRSSNIQACTASHINTELSVPTRYAGTQKIKLKGDGKANSYLFQDKYFDHWMFDDLKHPYLTEPLADIGKVYKNNGQLTHPNYDAQLLFDPYWGLQKSIDYFFDNHQWISYDGIGGKMELFSFTDLSPKDVLSTISGSTARPPYIRIGKADTFPMSSISTMGHEFMHCVLHATCQLGKQGETGAINEGIADIFGQLIHNEYLAESWDGLWPDGKLMRSYSNPKKSKQPDTYYGQRWHDTNANGDKGGIHVNNSIMTFWFYLLAKGGKGTNDNGYGHEYDIKGIGAEKAAKILFHSISRYFGPNENYYSVRDHTIMSAAYLYQLCSEEVLEVAKAWHAVGVGERDPYLTCRKKTLASIPTPSSIRSDNFNLSQLFAEDDAMQFGTSFNVYKNGEEIAANVYEFDLNETYVREQRKKHGPKNPWLGLSSLQEYIKDPQKFESALSPRAYFISKHYRTLYGKEKKMANGQKHYHYTTLNIKVPPYQLLINIPSQNPSVGVYKKPEAIVDSRNTIRNSGIREATHISWIDTSRKPGESAWAAFEKGFSSDDAEIVITHYDPDCEIRGSFYATDKEGNVFNGKFVMDMSVATQGTPNSKGFIKR